MSPLTITERNTAAGPVLEGLRRPGLRPRRRPAPTGREPPLRPGERLVVDLANLEFCDSTGITALLAARQHALAAGADIALASVPANTLRILTIVGLDRVFALRPDTTDA